MPLRSAISVWSQLPLRRQPFHLLAGVLGLSLGVPAVPDLVLVDVPPTRQPYNLCLAASVSMVLKYWGVAIAPQAIADQVAVYRDGTTGREMQRFVEDLDFRGFLIQPPFEDLLDHLRNGRPLVVAFPALGKSRQEMVLVGFTPARLELLLNDPASGKRRTLAYSAFRRRREGAQRWTFLIVPR